MIKFKELYPLIDGIVVIVYSVYQHILLDENARLSQVRQEGILYDKHKQQCRDAASDLSVRIQKLVQQEANGSDPADFGSGVHADGSMPTLDHRRSGQTNNYICNAAIILSNTV